MKAYKKEVRFTILMSFAFILMGNAGFFFVLFPTEAMLFGFPVKYIIPILMGWFGIFILTLIAGKIGNQIDEDIENENTKLPQTKQEKGRVA